MREGIKLHVITFVEMHMVLVFNDFTSYIFTGYTYHSTEVTNNKPLEFNNLRA